MASSNNIKPTKYPMNPDDLSGLFDEAVTAGREGNQDTLVSGTNIKTVNGNSLLGSGNISITASATWGGITGTLSSQTDLQTTLNGKEPSITAGTTSQYYRGDKTFQTLDKSAVGLSNVDNTSDANKPVSTTTQTALDTKPTNKLVIGTNVTGTIANTISANALLPANTLVTGKPCMIHIKARGRRVGSSVLAVIACGIYRNTSVSLSGATFLGQIQLTAATTLGQLERHLFWDGAGNISIQFAGTLVSDMINNGTYSTSVINPAVDNYFLYTIQCSNTGDTGQIQWGLHILYA
jgi:hypothetical protein